MLVVTVAFMVACSAPYALAWRAAPPGSSFSGLLLNHFDQNYYRAAQRSEAEGLVDRNRFTSEPGAPGPVSFLYPFLGQVQRATGLGPIVAYHLPRVLALALLPVLLLWLFGLCFPGRRDLVVAATGLTLFSTGVLAVAPWLPGALSSPESTVSEASVLRSLTTFPHFAVAYVGLVLAYGSVGMATRRKSPGAIAAVAATAGVLIAVSHPFLVLAVGLVLAAVGVASALGEWRARTGFAVTGRIAAAGVVVLPLIPLLVSLRREQERLEAANGAAYPSLPAGPLWTWPYAFGIVSVLAVVGAVSVARGERWEPGAGLLLAVAAAHLGLMYTPVTPFQRRFSEGLVIGLGGMAALGLWWCGRPFAGRRPVHWLLAAAVLLLGTLVTARHLGRTGEHLGDDLQSLMAKVSSHDIVLAGFEVASRVPALSNGKAYVARPVLTLRYEEKVAERRRWAEQPADPASLAWLRDAGITLVVVDAADPSFAPARVGPPAATCLAPFLARGGLVAFRVSVPCLEERAPGGP